MPGSVFDAVVLGGGCAGFAAATALAEGGARVLVLEARPGLGGRATAFTDPETGERVDNGQHILMGCYTDTLSMLNRIGTADRVRWQSGLTLAMIDGRGRRSLLALPALPSPLNFLAGVLAWDALSWGDRLSVLRVGASPSARPGETVRGWLKRHRQADRLCELLWAPLALAAINQSIDQAEASAFVRVLERVLGSDPSASALVLPAVPLDELYAEPARAWLEQRGSRVRVNAPGRVVIDHERVSGVRVRDESIAAPIVISTVPWYSLNGVFESPPPALRETLANAAALDSLPIVTVNLWFDAPVLREQLVGLPGRNFQWVFDRGAIVGDGVSHLSMISSGAEAIVAQPNAALVRLALDELTAAVPSVRTARVLKGLAVRERRSTFSLAPGAPPRPATRTAIEGLLLAGDWIDTGLPATIESAVISGHRAAAIAAESLAAPLSKP